jgi:PadR family transcriptional regulator, regulatory protein PadR
MRDHDPQMLKGVLALLLLTLCKDQEDYGYSIVLRLQQAGFHDVAEGTVYPALLRLESKGYLEAHLVRSSFGPARKYYRTTDDGRSEIARMHRSWVSLTRAVDAVLVETMISGVSVDRGPERSGDRDLHR